MGQDGKPAKATDSKFSVCFGIFTDSNSFSVSQVINKNSAGGVSSNTYWL